MIAEFILVTILRKVQTKYFIHSLTRSVTCVKSIERQSRGWMWKCDVKEKKGLAMNNLLREVACKIICSIQTAVTFLPHNRPIRLRSLPKRPSKEVLNLLFAILIKTG